MNSFLILTVLILFWGGAFWDNSTLGIKANSDVTVSGGSSGGIFASQMVVAYSADIKGAALIAAGTYFWTLGFAVRAADCQTTATLVLVDAIIKAAETFEQFGLIDKLTNLLGSKIFMFSGTKDIVVWQRAVKKHEKFFRKLGADVATEYSIPAQHSLATDFYGNKCSHLGKPFVNNWGYDTMKNSLEHLYGKPFVQTYEYIDANLHSFDQGKYNPGVTSSLGESGLIYIPNGCKDKECPLHVLFHGCEQTIKDIGLELVKGSGALSLAEENDIIILFPQVKKSLVMPINPMGCWDWWGYSEIIPTPLQWKFPTKEGIQMRAIHSMIKDLQSGSFEVHPKFAFEDTPEYSY